MFYVSNIAYKRYSNKSIFHNGYYILCSVTDTIP